MQVDWSPDPLSPAATGYKIYRNGSLLASVDGETFSFLDFNVIAGKFYTYEVSGVNTFGEGVRGQNLGFVNPNGVVTGQVRSFAGNPVPGTLVTLTPTIGASGNFTGSSMAFAEYSPAYPRNQFTLSAWVRLGAGNDNAAIFDLGSTISKNWWLHTLPAASGKGIRFGLGNGVGNVTNMDYAFPAATADDWHNVAVTYNGASLLLYVDGELISTAVASVATDSMTDFDLADSSTVEITVKAFDFATNQCLLNKGNHFNLNLNAGNLVLTLGSTTHNFGALGMDFHRLAFVIDQVAGSSTAAVTLYKNGTLVGSSTFSGVASDFSGGGGWLVGRNAGGNYFSGLIDEVVFYNTLLPLPAIQAAANIGTDLTNPFLNNYFPFNEGEGTSVKDYGLALTGNGTISGATFSTMAGITNIEPHLYTPSSRFVTLNPSNTSTDGVDFTDQSTIPVSGYVRFEGTDCFQGGVEILVNGQRNFPPVFSRRAMAPRQPSRKGNRSARVGRSIWQPL